MIATAPPPPKAVGAAATVTTPIPKEQVLRLAEEQLDVGKRMVQEGTTRIRRFVTEKPVEARVSLHEEHFPTQFACLHRSCAAAGESLSRSSFDTSDSRWPKHHPR